MTAALSRRTQLRLLALVAAALVAVAAAFIWFTQRGRGGEGGPPPPPGTFRPTPQQLKTFTIEPVASHAFATVVVADGRLAVDADRATPVYSPYSGRIVALRAGIGDVVGAGAELASIDASEFVQAQSDLAAAVAQVRLTKAALDRKQALYEAQGASLQDVQQAEAEHATASAALAAVEKRLVILGKSSDEIAALKNGSRDGARIALRAPLAGVVVDRQAGPGQYIQAGAGTALFTIADTRTVWVIGNVAESAARDLHRGQPVEVRVAAWPERVFAARLTSVAAVVDPATHRLTVRAELANGDGVLKPEMLATLRIVTSAAAPTVAVPAGAVVYEGERAHVWVVRDGDVIALRAIRAGRTADGLVEVVDGLAPGEKIVTRGSLFIDRAARHD